MEIIKLIRKFLSKNSPYVGNVLMLALLTRLLFFENSEIIRLFEILVVLGFVYIINDDSNNDII